MLKGDIMDYYNHNCPVCNKKFSKGDDVVVCPICGTPHHRECYQNHGNCYFAYKHDAGYTYNKESSSEKTETPDNSCQYCGTQNAPGSKFCSSCNMPLSPTEEQPQPPFGSPFTGGHNGTNGNTPPGAPFVLDPLGGVASETDIGDGITAAEAAKYVKSNTPFFSRLFYQIKVFGKSRFSFVGFFFSGGWLLYRKMYLLGTIITFLMGASMFAEIFLTYGYNSFLTTAIEKISEILNSSAAGGGLSDVWAYAMSLNTEYQIILGSYFFVSFLRFAISIICGLCANRWYYKHCKKQIKKIKNSADSKEIAQTNLETKGGVNTGLAISLAVSYLVITYLPSMLFGG